MDMAPIHQYESLLDTFHTSASQSLLQAISIAMANNFDKFATEKSEYGLRKNESVLSQKEIVCLRLIFSSAYNSLIRAKWEYSVSKKRDLLKSIFFSSCWHIKDQSKNHDRCNALLLVIWIDFVRADMTRKRDFYKRHFRIRALPVLYTVGL